ncbi:MAG TPA: flagellar hook-associated protein 3, partial [Deltaproteobacteria bacterium]|nr:flagellar hook-associated protein 3 [Deltaproteobacteria bacterium]
EYSITGDTVFAGSGEDSVDIFAVLDDLKEALENNDTDGILGQVDDLKQSSVQVNTGIARCGTRMNRLEIAGNNLTDLDFKLTEMISSREDVDISALVTDFSMQEIVLKATYSVASRMGNITLLDFLD